jgi:hypothetical protein
MGSQNNKTVYYNYNTSTTIGFTVVEKNYKILIIIVIAAIVAIGKLNLLLFSTL